MVSNSTAVTNPNTRIAFSDVNFGVFAFTWTQPVPKTPARNGRVLCQPSAATPEHLNRAADSRLCFTPDRWHLLFPMHITCKFRQESGHETLVMVYEQSIWISYFWSAKQHFAEAKIPHAAQRKMDVRSYLLQLTAYASQLAAYRRFASARTLANTEPE